MDYDIQGAKKQYAEILKSGNNDRSKQTFWDREVWIGYV